MTCNTYVRDKITSLETINGSTVRVHYLVKHYFIF